MRQIFPDSSLSALNSTTSAAGIISSMTNQSVFTRDWPKSLRCTKISTMSKAGRWPESYTTRPFLC